MPEQPSSLSACEYSYTTHHLLQARQPLREQQLRKAEQVRELSPELTLFRGFLEAAYFSGEAMKTSLRTDKCDAVL